MASSASACAGGAGGRGGAAAAAAGRGGGGRPSAAAAAKPRPERQRGAWAPRSSASAPAGPAIAAAASRPRPLAAYTLAMPGCTPGWAAARGQPAVQTGASWRCTSWPAGTTLSCSVRVACQPGPSRVRGSSGRPAHACGTTTVATTVSSTGKPLATPSRVGATPARSCTTVMPFLGGGGLHVCPCGDRVTP